MKELLFKPHVQNPGSAYGYGWSVGKEKLPQSKREVSYVRHNGAINGFTSVIKRCVDDRHLIVLLDNASGSSQGTRLLELR